MSTISEEILSFLSKIKDPVSKKLLSSQIINLSVHEKAVILVVEPLSDDENILKNLEELYKKEIQRVTKKNNEIREVKIIFSAHNKPKEPSRSNLHSKVKISGVKKTIVVASGKGGVGKSTIASALAAHLLNLGYKVGVADLDIYGPSIPTLFNANEKPRILENRKIQPIVKKGIKLMSLGFLVDEGQAVIWRGPMLTKAIAQILSMTDWSFGNQDLDFLILDTPPGTGDVHLTLSSKYELDGCVVVSTPQELSVLDAHKSVQMYQKLQIPVLGVVENMSYMDVKKQKIYIFGNSRLRDYCKENEIKLIGEIPVLEKLASSDWSEEISNNEELRSVFDNIKGLL